MSSSRTLPCGRNISGKRDVISDVKLLKYEKLLKDYLSRENLKWTRQRWSIATLILKTVDHLDAQEIVERVRDKDKNIGVATIYRNIKVLVEAGIIRMTHQDIEGRSRYEICEKGRHDHIYCMDCGEILEFIEPKFVKLQEKVAADRNFTLVDHRHVIHARCEYLKKKRG